MLALLTRRRIMTSKFTLVLLLYITLRNIQHTLASEDSCPREENVINRTCLKRCETHEDCVSRKKKCLCDGKCGMSCVNKNIRCKAINTKISNGKVVIFPFNQFGAVAKYSCVDSYKLVGLFMRVCQGDLSWSGEEPECVLNTVDGTEKNQCGDPPTVHHAEHDGDKSLKGYPNGHMLDYRCKKGFSARRDSVFRAWCVGGGVWVGPNMTCSHAGCPLLPQIENGRVEILPPSMIASKAQYSCFQGFHLAGRATRTCRPDGTWDGMEPSCERVVCNQPPSIENALHNAPREQARFPAGTELMYTCRSTYTASGYQRAMCKGDGTWSGPKMACTKSDDTKPETDCKYPGEVSNGRREGQDFRYPAKVTYFCNEGFQLIGNPVRECQINGQWSGSLPLCNPIRCEKLGPPLNGFITGSGETYNTVLRFSCPEGYKLVGSAERRCMSDGEWSGQLSRCQVSTNDPQARPEKNCGLPGPLWNGYLDGHRTTVGAVFFFRCNVRTTFDGPSFSTQCQDNGAWSHPPPKCWGQCQVPSILNGTVMHSREGMWVDHETFINFRCREGLVLNDTSDIKCINGSWTLIPRCIPETQRSISPVTAPTQKTGTISGLPEEEAWEAPCSAQPPNIENGRRVYIGWKHGDRAKYMCFQGFRLRGDLHMTCRFGRWVGSRPYCDEIFCPNPGKLENGKIHKKGQIGKFEFKAYIVTIRHGDRLLYECDRGYELDGASGATCVDGNWSPIDKPECKPGQHPILHKLWKPIEEQAHSNQYYL
ncbi:sushi, von Willebrand factor type A, EGF and pentraxin domain-containing protein 1 isoform X4 [Octopus sinensis]|uniref:Sushi, von Willebrand factor type A, EGF and pentraxin domain-containing protein 1 isoform X4 n=1 Tax=Octopus sinensis TaxID=2607531 RepID=A0A6P7SQR4_9MOLL|nr:sushi, von Willebrand factor type A, EGF and pentraxin domain-containing protein 1 isoform X4 [Octopus sinensis]